nr:MAG: hypothetical protein [Microviridae sp.]
MKSVIDWMEDLSLLLKDVQTTEIIQEIVLLGSPSQQKIAGVIFMTCIEIRAALDAEIKASKVVPNVPEIV